VAIVRGGVQAEIDLAGGVAVRGQSDGAVGGRPASIAGRVFALNGEAPRELVAATDRGSSSRPRLWSRTRSSPSGVVPDRCEDDAFVLRWMTKPGAIVAVFVQARSTLLNGSRSPVNPDGAVGGASGGRVVAMR